MADISTGRASEGGHWYARDGSSVYEICGANGKMRPATIADARKLGLVPGFSTIAKMEHAPNLERWKIDQAYLAALTLPRIEGETLEEFRRRAYEDAQAQSNKARDRGTHLHAAMQGFYEDKPVAYEDAPYVLPVTDWLSKCFPGAQWEPEQSFAHPAGYGGKCDLRTRGVVIDFKFKDFDESGLIDKYGKPKRFAYESHEMQLHAYEYGFGMIPGIKLNLFISSTVPGLFIPHEWSHNPDSLEAFMCLLKLWQIRRGYDSSFPAGWGKAA